MPRRTLYTIGHSNQSIEEFIALLRQHKIDVLADVRSAPYSRWVPHFNKAEIEQAVKDAGLTYIYLGNELGGRPEPAEFYDAEGHALYAEMARTPEFKRGIVRLKSGIKRYRVAIMCSEEDPSECHRRLLVGRVLHDDGDDILHIRGDGSIDSERELREAELRQPRQQQLFEVEEEMPEWKSARSVSPANRPKSSSDS